MTHLIRISSLAEDPLHAYSGLSLFPRTLKSLSIPLFQSDDIQHTHTLLQSMPFEIQNEHQEQAKAILDDSSELIKQGIRTSAASEDMNIGLKMNPVQSKRERRPGLDRKRGQFSFKPTTSQPPSNGPTFDGSKYPKPEEYSAAYERFKNAKREWDKQNGISVTDTQQNQPSRRPRRLGIPGRKRVSYKHTYTDSYSADATSLETSEKENPIASEQSLERVGGAHSSADIEVDEVVDTDKNLENILSELLACDKDDLMGDGAVKLLEERLQIKPINVNKFTIPEFQDVREMRLKASGRNPSNGKSVLSDIQNMLQGIHGDAIRKTRQSPSTLTKKQISSSSPPVDQFSFPDSNYLLPGDLQSSEVDLTKDLNVCSRSPVTNDADKDITNPSPSNVGTVYIASTFNSSMQKSSNEGDSNTHSGNHSSHWTPDGNADNCVDDSIRNRNSATLEVNVDMQKKGNERNVPMIESEANGNTGRSENNADTNEETDKLDSLVENASREAVRMDHVTKKKRMDHVTVDEDNIPYQQDESLKSPSRTPEQCNTINGSFEQAEHSQEQHEEVDENTNTACRLQVENAQVGHDSSHEQAKKRRRGYCDNNKKKRSKTVVGESEGYTQMKTLSHESGAKKQTKRKSNEPEEKKKQTKRVTREGKLFAQRKSLAAAGTKWESGVRRSTRIKSRPLEYWRGERFLLGRIHESLATVIGLKYASPEKYASKVKSFVSDDYKEMVDLAALH